MSNAENALERNTFSFAAKITNEMWQIRIICELVRISNENGTDKKNFCTDIESKLYGFNAHTLRPNAKKEQPHACDCSFNINYLTTIFTNLPGITITLTIVLPAINS